MPWSCAQQLAGYRAALDYLFTEDWRPLNAGLLLHLHRLLFAETKATGGTFRQSDNLVVDRSPDGVQTVRFKPVPAARPEYYAADLIDRYADAAKAGQHHPVLLVGLFVLDLLIIHPFDDGNGRVARALTNDLLAEAGYGSAATSRSSNGAPVFAISDVRAALPGISDPAIRLVLNELKDEGLLKPQGTGRSAVWLRVIKQSPSASWCASKVCTTPS